ncbi:MAG: 4-hydroxy-tetrahydrodipicolinate reductase [Candidatus Poribacteria bacterium]
MIDVIVDGAGGRMGRMIINGISQSEDMQLVGAIEAANHPNLGRDAGEIAGVGRLGVSVTSDLPAIIDKCDVVIEFTSPEATLKHLQNVVDADKAMVIATTGYTDEQMEQLLKLAPKIRCVMSPNYSIGVNLLLKLVQNAAQVLGDDFDIEVIEAHHNMKKDSPSGTALRIAEVIAESLNRNLDEVGVYGRRGMVGERPRQEIGVHAIRGGDIVGDHTVLFAGVGERLEITHRAQSRETFARGALRAARWVVNAPRGLHDIDKVLFGG